MRVDRSILMRNDQNMGDIGDPDKLENSIEHLANVVDINDDTVKSLTEENTKNKESIKAFQNQLDQIAKTGDSSLEASQARVKADGTAFDTLRDRLNAADNRTSGILHMKEFAGIQDDFTALQTAFDAAEGKTLVLEKNRIYEIPNEKTLNTKPNTTLVANGAKFKKSTQGSNYILLINDSFKADYIGYVPFWSASETGVKIIGSNVQIELYESIADLSGCGGDSVSRNALFIDGSLGQLKNIKIGKIITKNWDRPLQVRNVKGVEIKDIDIDTFKQGAYLRNVLNSNFPLGHLRGLSPNCNGSPGENGVLIESVDLDDASRFITISNWVVEDTGEHGFRLGGQSTISDVTFSDCVSIRPGRGTIGNGTTELGIGHGGCGFKTLGPTSSTKRHRNIRFVNCTAEDGRTDVPVSRVNFAGFQIGKCLNVVIDNPIVRTKGASASDRSFVNGIEIIGCEDVTISNPNIGFVLNNGIHFYDSDQSTGDFGTLLSRVKIDGGLILNPGNSGLSIVARNYVFRRVSFNGILLDTGAAPYAVFALKSGAGSFAGCSVSGYVNPNSSASTLEGLNDWLVDLTGVFTNTPNHAANGSTFRDTNGNFKIRKAGAWVNI